MFQPTTFKTYSTVVPVVYGDTGLLENMLFNLDFGPALSVLTRAHLKE